MMFLFSCVLYVTFLLQLLTCQSLNPLVIKGYKFFDSETGEEVLIRGIDYYPRPNAGDLDANSLDFYTEKHRNIWERDIPILQKLGVNAIRLYSVDPGSFHDPFMCALEAAGIYVIVSLAHDCPTCAITRDQASPSGDCYPPELKAQGQQVIQDFARFPNTLAFSAGNEVNHFAPSGQPQWNAPCQKKFLRDMREFVHSCSHIMRQVPIGLVAADSDRDVNALYYNCQGDPHDKFETAEWYGLNSYVTCSGDISDYKDALGLHTLQESFDGYNLSVPVLLTEFGCLSDSYPTINGHEGQRTFLEAKWMLQEPDLRKVFAGGFAFEYSMEAANAAQESPYPYFKFGKQNYGIGYFGPEQCDDVNVPCKYTPLPSFESLRKAFAKSNIVNLTTMDSFSVEDYRKELSKCPQEFPNLSSIVWEADKYPFSKCSAHYESMPTCNALDSLEVEMNEYRNTVGVGTLLLLAFFSCYLLGTYKRYRRRAGYDSMKPIASNDSEESTGLFSLMAFQGSLSRYHAIDSDSSSGTLATP